MKRTHLLTAGVVFLSMLMAAALPVPAAAETPEVGIQVAPAVINLQNPSQHDRWVTVHVDIPYSDVKFGNDDQPLILITIAPDCPCDESDEASIVEIRDFDKWFADDCGDFVVKFRAGRIGDLNSGFYTLTLTGATNSGTRFTGSQCVYVRLDRGSAPGKK